MAFSGAPRARVTDHSPLAPWLDDGHGATESAVEVVGHVEPTEGAPLGRNR